MAVCNIEKDRNKSRKKRSYCGSFTHTKALKIPETCDPRGRGEALQKTVVLLLHSKWESGIMETDE